MYNTAILVMTCDSYEDAWKPFFALKEKYWADCPFPVYVGTEKKDCQYADYTLKHTGSWTKRVRESLQEMDCEYVVFMLEDFFIRYYVDQEFINMTLFWFDDKTAVFSFEEEFDPTYPSDVFGFRLKPNKSRYLHSCMPSIWRKSVLIDELNCDTDAWKWEKMTVDSPLKFHILEFGNQVIDIGYKKFSNFGIKQGKWVKSDVVPLFEKENIEIDLLARGFYEKD
jgi:hypothetical protein